VSALSSSAAAQQLHRRLLLALLFRRIVIVIVAVEPSFLLSNYHTRAFSIFEAKRVRRTTVLAMQEK